MNYCTRCGRKLSSSGDCPYCSNRYYGRRSQPVIRAVQNGCSSYTTLVLAGLWTISILSLLVFSGLTLNPLFLIAVPGILVVIGLWMIYGGEGHTQRMGLTLVSGALMFISILAVLVLTALCMTCFLAIFLCTSEQNYDSISASLLILAVGLLIALPVTAIFLNKVRRIAVTSRSVLLRSRTKVDVPIFAIAVFLLGAPALIFAAINLSNADAFLTELRTMIGGVIPNPYYTIFSWLIGISWEGMLFPFLILAASFLYTFAVLIRYRLRLGKAKKELKEAEAAAKANKKKAMGYTEAEEF